ncbi:MAG: DNA topoisomerase [Methanosarcinaceae archaeon]|nr:DNA topoisomerase [Methanosarcinaceae archaeon]
MKIAAFAEKNTAAQQIAEILSDGSYKRINVSGVTGYEFSRNGNDWRIIGLAGHIMGYDYPKKYQNWNDVDPKVLIETEPVKTVTKENFSTAVEELAKPADLLILACDYDREGENIGFEAKEIAQNVSVAPVKRAKYSSFTEEEIKRAFDNPVEPDTNMAMAADVRQILDLKMGASFTRYVTLSVREKAYTKEILSIGPCQTPTCGFIYEREKLIRNFVSKDFWKITADFISNGSAPFQGTHRAGNITEKQKADEIFNKIRNEKKAVVARKSVKEQNELPPNPLNTTEFLKRASNYLGINSDRALEIAEQLYLAGFISYPRTETNKYGDDVDFVKILSLIGQNPEYKEIANLILSKPIVPKNGPKDAKDHPPIHPVYGATPESVKKTIPAEEAYPIYDLICRHFMATLLPPAVFEKTRLEIKIKDESFDTAGSVLVNPGYRAIYNYETKNDKTYPFMNEGDIIDVSKVMKTKSKTSPPKKLTESELLTLMDKNGIGTKATAPSHIETNKKRGYIELKGKTISITDTGFRLMESLDNAVPVVVKPKVRAQIESLIQQVEESEISFDSACQKGTEKILDMYSDLTKNKEKLVLNMAGSIKSEAAEEDKKTYIGKCNVCKNALRIITTDNGRFVGCVGYPDCNKTYPLPKNGAITILRSKLCPKTGYPVLDVGKKYNWSVGVGPCFGCTEKDVCFPPEIAGLCPRCKEGNMVLIRLTDSRFLGCSKKCGHTQSLPKAGRLTMTDDLCPVCGWKMFRLKEINTDAEIFCANRRCRAIGKRKANN